MTMKCHPTLKLAAGLLALGVNLSGAAQSSDAGTAGNATSALAVLVDDRIHYGDGAAAARVPARLVSALQDAGRFSRVDLNRFDLPLQLRVRLDRKSAESESASTGKLLAGAATLFLLPIKGAWEYSFEFDLECRGQLVGQWRYSQVEETTQSLLSDPEAGQAKVIKETMAKLLQDGSGPFAAACR